MSKIIGLTGQSGSGKTTVCDVFKNNGFGIINCDLISRNVTADGSQCNKVLSQIFPSCFNEDLHLDRQALAEIVFSDKNKLQKLDETIYPFIISDIKKTINLMSEYEYIILDAPTLFEAGVNKMCDIIVSVVADEALRFERIKKRDGISDELINKRFSSQLGIEFFKANSDCIIENNEDKNYAVKQTQNVIKAIKESTNG